MSDDLDPFSDDELTALALAADPTEMLDDDAVPFEGERSVGLLPDWYMPAPQVSAGSRPSSRRRGCWSRRCSRSMRSACASHTAPSSSPGEKPSTGPLLTTATGGGRGTSSGKTHLAVALHTEYGYTRYVWPYARDCWRCCREGPRHGYQLKTEFEARDRRRVAAQRRPGVHDPRPPRARRPGHVDPSGGAAGRRPTPSPPTGIDKLWARGGRRCPSDEPPPRDELMLKVLMAIEPGPRPRPRVITRPAHGLLTLLQVKRRERARQPVRPRPARTSPGRPAGRPTRSGPGRGRPALARPRARTDLTRPSDSDERHRRDRSEETSSGRPRARRRGEALRLRRDRGARAQRRLAARRARRAGRRHGTRPGAASRTLLHLAGGLEDPIGRPGARGRARSGRSSATRSGGAAAQRRSATCSSDSTSWPSLTAIENVMLPLELDGVRRASGTLGPGGAGRRRARRPARPLPRRLLRRAAAAHRHRPRHRRRHATCCWPTSRPARSTRSPATSVIELLAALPDDDGTAVVLVTHEPRYAAWADRVVFLRDGRDRRPDRVDTGRAGTATPVLAGGAR